MAQLCCSNAQCRVVLLYPRGAGQVQCSVCGNLNDATQANQLGHLVCGGCQVTLAYARGAQSVKCSVCGCVTPAESSGSSTLAAQHARLQQQGGTGTEQHQHAQQHVQQQASHAARTASSKQQTVLVVNPGDEAGNEGPNVAIGVTNRDAK